MELITPQWLTWKLDILGVVLTCLRESAGFTQRDIYERMSVSQVVITRAENGQMNLTLARLNQYAYCLGRTALEILTISEAVEALLVEAGIDIDCGFLIEGLNPSEYTGCHPQTKLQIWELKIVVEPLVRAVTRSL